MENTILIISAIIVFGGIAYILRDISKHFTNKYTQ